MLQLNTVHLFDLPIRNITLEHAVDVIRSCLSDGRPAALYFVNAHCVNVAQDDDEYKALLQTGTHVFADGVGMRIAAILNGTPLVDNVNGTDLFPLLCSALAGTGTRVFFLGATPGVAERLRDRVYEQYPDLLICGVHHGYFDEREEAQVAEAIRSVGTEVLLVAMGVPQQEKWIARNLTATGVKVAIGVGALFDLYSGRFRRSPPWMRRLGLEWLGRLVQEPQRLWRRYLVGNVRFLWLAAVHGIRKTV